MTAYEKITISLPSRAAETARRAVKAGRAPSVSAYVVEALESYERAANLDALLAEMLEETGGSLTPAETRAADRALGLTPGGKRDPRRPRKRRVR